MRFLCFLFLVAFLGAIALLAWQNQEEVTLIFFTWTQTASLALVIAAAYVLGMLSGWSVVGLVRRSFKSVVADAERRQRVGY